jgi:hypothetical protein
MALEISGSSAIYLAVFNGKITRRVEAGTPNANQRENKNGKVVHELTYDKLSGRLSNIEFRDGDYGREIHFTLKDELDIFRLQLPYSSKVAKSIIMRLLKCDLSANLEIHTGWDKEKESTFSYITQNGEVVKSAYTKEEPNGLPPMEQKKMKGKEVWDDSEQLEFLGEMIKKEIMPKLNKLEKTIIIDDEPENKEEKTSNGLPF